MRELPAAIAHVDDADRGFAHRQDLGSAGGNADDGFPMRDRGVECVHLRHTRRHRVCDHVRPGGHCGGEIDRAVGLQRVDAHCCEASRIAPALQQHHQSSAGFLAAHRRREVLQVDDQRVGAARPHRLMGVSAGAGTEQPGAPQVGL
jgi:hypothetical protein